VIRRLSLVGLGLLGGSVAKAARAEGLADEIVAVGRERERLEPALRDGVVDRISTRLEEGVAGSDFCLLATPVATLTALLPAVWPALPADAVLTDVGSTKASIVEAIKATNLATIVGQVDFTVGVPVPNVAKTPLVGGQWVTGSDFPYDLVVVSNSQAADIPVAASLQPITPATTSGRSVRGCCRHSAAPARQCRRGSSPFAVSRPPLASPSP